MLRRIFGPKRYEIQGNGENYIIRSLTISTLHYYICGIISRRIIWVRHVACMETENK
jgi:hypothetical protein